MTENYDRIRRLAAEDADVLVEKGKHYGDSWKQRGGVGAFMMLARKWDRLEQHVQNAPTKYDILEAGADDGRDESVLDDIADLRRYLFLVHSEILELRKAQAYAAKAAAKASGRFLLTTDPNARAEELDGLGRPKTFDTGEPQGKGYVDQDR